MYRVMTDMFETSWANDMKIKPKLVKPTVSQDGECLGVRLQAPDRRQRHARLDDLRYGRPL